MTHGTPPKAAKVPYESVLHGESRNDDWFWLRDKNNPDVIALLEAENTYTETVLAPHKEIREKIFLELKNRIMEDDSEVPVRIDDTYYYSRVAAGKQYAIHCRKRGHLRAAEEILLDENVLAEGKPYFSLGVFEISPDQDWLAFAVDFEGSEHYVLRFKNLATGELSPEEIHDVSTSVEWAEDSRTVFYNLLDSQTRPDRLMRHRLGTDATSDTLIHKEEDPQIFVYCSKSKSRRFIFLQLYGKVTSEYRYIEANDPESEMRVIEPRRRGVLYSVTHHGDDFYIVTNDEEVNFRIVRTSAKSPGCANWKEFCRGHRELYIEGIEAFRDHLVIFERERGLEKARVIELPSLSEHTIEFKEPAYTLQPMWNPEFNSHLFRFSYSSLVTPQTVYDYDLSARTREIKKVREVPGGYDPSQYESERIFATANDGAQVPISLVYKKGFRRDGNSPLYLYGYGSYGHSLPPGFSTNRLSLLDRGFVYAIAHVRGGADLGRHWYDDGKFLKKMNTFTDFTACATHLIKEKYTSKGSIVIAGGSAGGMLVGAALNLEPDLFRGAIAHVPFVDVINTMGDETLPLTTLEYEEWGNPQEKAYYETMKTYSPYDNVKRQAYPSLLVTAGLNDPRVTYWEPAKWVQKLRDMKTDSNLLLFHIHMDAGHGGASGRFDALKDTALEYTFIFKIFNLLPQS